MYIHNIRKVVKYLLKKNKGSDGVKMTTTVQKWGNSLAVRIPKHIGEFADIKEGLEVDITVDDQQAIKIIPKTKKPTLEELMAKITPENQHKEVDWGKPEGAEIW
mgnify:CR=1 FL=1